MWNHILTFLNYWWSVAVEGISIVFKKIVGRFLEVTLAFLVACLIAFGFYSSQPPLFQQELAKAAQIFFTSWNTYLVGIGITFLLLFVIIPPQKDKKKADVIIDYEDKWGMTEVKAYKLGLFGDSDSIEKKAVLCVTNNETEHANKCYAVLRTGLINEGDGWKNRTSTINQKAQGGKFPWYEHGANSEWNIHRGTTEKLGIASLGEDGRITFTFGNRGHSIDNIEAGIYVEILFMGEMQSGNGIVKPIEPKTFTGFIVRKKGSIYLESGESPT